VACDDELTSTMTALILECARLRDETNR
jgi:hypothetical protein